MFKYDLFIDIGYDVVFLFSDHPILRSSLWFLGTAIATLLIFLVSCYLVPNPLFGAVVITLISATLLAGTDTGAHAFIRPLFLDVARRTSLIAVFIGYATLFIYVLSLLLNIAFSWGSIIYTTGIFSALNMWRALDQGRTDKTDGLGGLIFIQITIILFGIEEVIRYLNI